MNLAMRLTQLEKVGGETGPWVILDLDHRVTYTSDDIRQLKVEAMRRTPGLRILVPETRQ